jgi:flagellar basal-body rod modification protein FlgD
MATSNVTSTGSSYQALLDSVNTSKTTTTSTAASDAQDRFLKLLTAQLKNQDPLNPLDNAQMTSQLAQISTVSGIEKLNATLQLLLQGNQDSQTTQAAGLVGHSVLVPGSALLLASSAAVGGIELASAADTVTVTIKDANGLAVRTISLGAQDAGIHNFVWDGKSDSGAQAADGNYSITVTAKQGSNSVTASALSLGLVRSVVRGSNGLLLDVGTLGAFTMDDVKQII